MSSSSERRAYHRSAAALAIALSREADVAAEYAEYEELARQLARGEAASIVTAAAKRQAVVSKGEGIVVAGGKWAPLETELIKAIDEGVIELKGTPPELGELPDGQGWYETFRFGPYVTFTKPPEEIGDPDTGAVAWSLTVNEDRNVKTVRLAMPKLTAVPGTPLRFTLDGKTPIEATIIQSASEVSQALEKVALPWP